MLATATKQVFSRADVLRMLYVSERQLRSWEKQQLVTKADSFSWTDILAIRALVELRKNNVRAAQIRKAVVALRESMHNVENPLGAVRVYSDGGRIQVQYAGQKMEAITGQLLLDFDALELSKLLAFPGKKNDEQPKNLQKNKLEAERWFEKGLDLEQSGAPVEEILEAYRNACALDPKSAGAFVNLGTIHFNARQWRDAENSYRKALEVDPEYALAHFNLGNLFDERGDRAKALQHYLAALRVHPKYADAHYNIALLYQSTGQPLKAVRHWKMYLKLDSGSSWAAIARRELAKLRDATIVPGRGGQ